MSGVLKPYPRYAATATPWLDRVPIHWRPVPLGALARWKNERGFPSLPLLSVYREYGVIDRSSRDDNHNPEGTDLSAYKVVSPGDLVVNKMQAWQGSLGVSRYHGIVSPAYIVCDVIPEVEGWYLHHLLRSQPCINLYNQLSVGIRLGQWDLRWEDLKRVPVYLPSTAEQREIVAFLESVNRAVNSLIRAKRQQIELLNEQKQGIIAQMLTGKSESAVSRKSSGADWLGDVPSHWDIVPLKHLSRWIQNGTTPPTSERRYYDNGTIPWFGPSSIGDEFSAGTPVRLLAEEAFRDGKARLIHGPALLVVVIGATAGKSALLPGIGSSNQQLTAYELRRDRVVPEFVAYQVRMTEKWLRSSASTATIPILDTYTVSGLPIAVPPLVEQMAIVDEVNRALKPLSATIDLMHQQVALLREYRTRLIADVVTGKLDVSNVELPDSDGAGLLADGVCDADFVSDLDDDEPSDTEEVEADAED